MTANLMFDIQKCNNPGQKSLTKSHSRKFNRTKKKVKQKERHPTSCMAALQGISEPFIRMLEGFLKGTGFLMPLPLIYDGKHEQRKPFSSVLFHSQLVLRSSQGCVSLGRPSHQQTLLSTAIKNLLVVIQESSLVTQGKKCYWKDLETHLTEKEIREMIRG